MDWPTPGTTLIRGVASKSDLRLFEDLFFQSLFQANIGLMLGVVEES